MVMFVVCGVVGDVIGSVDRVGGIGVFGRSLLLRLLSMCCAWCPWWSFPDHWLWCSHLSWLC